ncbi:ATP-binding cassette domain-containing protein [Gemmobacter lutimaris]|uniref:ATP-binding cassette domain-containing protein n=1 Tax=Gemmobacter lutimaris TaxID=2306023 RepID=A0A398BIL0_9RHOB|nr:ATP-binding cassette domain-containing protein [Gemmobacter lutimaris]RID90395.1 ATP-binding cassette domain-containing protein [Gemmobacter lutimaris]
MGQNDNVISCKNVWKVFGDHPERLTGHLKPETTSEELRATGHVAAVRNVSLDIARGEMLVVMGLSGSGKSTLIRCLARLIDITDGAITVEGRDLGTMTETELIDLRRRKMGMVFQSFGLLPHRTALENVAFPLEMRGQDRISRIARASEMLNLVGLGGREGYFPRELSGGQQQRVGIARSLAVEPDIWFLDEPFSALDPLIRREMQDEFLRLKGMLAKTIVFITHDFDEALRLADRIAIMKDGAIEQIDTPERIVMAPATPYVAKFTSAVDRARVVHAGALALAVEGRAIDGPALPAIETLHALARRILQDDRALIPVAGRDGVVTGLIDRAAALDLLLGPAA